jgi:hypothetical protein
MQKAMPCVRRDLVAVALHNAVTDSQPQSQPRADLVGREKRIVNAREVFGRDAATESRKLT